MANKIVKGPVSKVESEDLYDDDGIKYKKYKFKVEGKHVTLKVHKSEYITDGDLIIVELNDNYDAVAGLLPLRNYKWGKTSALKAYKSENDIFKFAEGKIIEKRKLDMVSTPSDRYRKPANFTIVFEDINFTVPNHIGKRLKAGDVINVALVDDFASVIYDKNKNKWYGVQYPYYIIFILAAIALPLTIFYLRSIGNNLFVRPKATIIVLDSFFIFFGLINFSSCRHSSIAKRFLQEKMK